MTVSVTVWEGAGGERRSHQHPPAAAAAAVALRAAWWAAALALSRRILFADFFLLISLVLFLLGAVGVLLSREVLFTDLLPSLLWRVWFASGTPRLYLMESVPSLYSTWNDPSFLDFQVLRHFCNVEITKPASVFLCAAIFRF